MENSWCLSASCTFTVMGCPSRLKPKVTMRPGGISWIIRRNCAPLSIDAPFMVRMTSCSLIPALPAGASWSTIVTSTPFSSFRFKALRRSVVTSDMSTPRYELVPLSSLENANGCSGGSTDRLCSACEKVRNNGKNTMLATTYLRMAKSLNRNFVEPAGSRRAGVFKASTAGALEADVARRGMYLHRRTAAIQLAFGSERLRAPLVAFAADADIGKIGSDVVSVAHIHTGAHVDGYIGGDIHRDVARARFQIGIVTLAARIHQLHRDPARARFSPARGHAIKLNAATAGLRVNMSLSGGQPDAPAPGFDLRRTANVTQAHAAAAG